MQAGPEVWLHDLQHVVPRLPFHLKANDALLLLVFFCACQQLGGQTWRTLFTPPSVRCLHDGFQNFLCFRIGQ